MLGQVLLKLRRLVRELLLELFDQGRLADAARLDRLVGFGARPPAAIDNAQGLVLVGHANILVECLCALCGLRD